MPKKRHFAKYTKPPSVAPSSLSTSTSPQASSQHHERSVNELLADLRRTTLTPDAAQSTAQQLPSPSVPPQLREILQLPATPAPPPRRPQPRVIRGRRAPPGPPPPRSWLDVFLHQVHAQPDETTPEVFRIHSTPLPGAYRPRTGSLVDIALRGLGQYWGVQRDWNRFYLYTLPSPLRMALLYYIAELYEPGLTATDVGLILSGPPEHELAEYDLEKPDPAGLNDDIHHVDLASLVGKSLGLKPLINLFFSVVSPGEADVLESWETGESSAAPSKLLPSITQLSLAVSPKVMSWRQLMSLSNRLPTLTHLNLTGWPIPSLTPNAVLAKVESPSTGLSAHYGGTNAYSHSLDNDWSEAVLLLRRLSKALYSLEYLDLSGCAAWWPALRISEQGASVDWAGDWGKVTTLRLCSGYAIMRGHAAQASKITEFKDEAIRVGKHIRAQRAGRGRFITVDMDPT